MSYAPVVNSSFSLPQNEFDKFDEFRQKCKRKLAINGSELIRILIKQGIKEDDFDKIKSWTERIERFSAGRKKIRSSEPDYTEITDEQWEKLKIILAEKNILSNEKRPGRRRQRDLRVLMNGMFHLIGTECGWRNIPERYGNGQAVLRLYNHLRKERLLNKIYDYYIDLTKTAQIEEKERIFRKILM